MMNRQKKSWMIFSLAAFVSTSLFSYDIGKEDTRGIRSEPLRISSRKDSPAYTAFVVADLKFSNESALDLSSTTAPIKLAAGKSFAKDLLADEQISVPLTKVSEQNQQLKGMVISSRQLAPTPKAIEVAAAKNPTNLDIASADDKKDWVKELQATLPPDQSRRLAAIEDWLKGQSWSADTPTRAEVWKQKIKESAPTDKGETLINTAGGGQIYVGLPTGERKVAPEASSLVAGASPINKTWKPSAADVELNQRPLTITGSLEMKDGLAFLGSQTSIVVTRKLGEREIESGTVWISEGRFEIFVKEAKGHLVAELRDKTGGTLGRGILDLYKLPTAAGHQTKVEGVQLSLSPITKGSQVATLSAHSFGGRDIPVHDSEILSAAHDIKLKAAENLHITEDYSPGSTALLETVSPKSLPTLEVSQLAPTSNVYVFEEKYVRALVEFVAPTETDLIKEKGFIIGRVADLGKPVAGSQVEIAGDFTVEPIYFNEAFLPDRGLKATSSNGMFAAVLVEPSLYSIRVKANGVFLPAKVLPVAKGQVTQSLFDRKELTSLAVNVTPFPEETSAVQQVSVSVLGTEEDRRLGIGSHILQYQEGEGVFVLEASAGDFDPLLRMELPHGATAVDVPIITRYWLDGIVTKKRVNLNPESGKVLGFGPSENFEVIVDKGQGDETVVYLDAEGKPVYQGLGQPGGSFLIYNLKPGLHTVSILSKNGSKIFSRVIVAEFDVVNVISAP